MALQDPGELRIDEIASSRGVTGVHVLARDLTLARPSTNEESLRAGGSDAAIERVLIVEGHDLRALDLPGERYRLSHLMAA